MSKFAWFASVQLLFITGCFMSALDVSSHNEFFFKMSHFAVTPGEGCTAWGRNTCLQQDEEDGERKGSRKKGRSRGCGPYREHSADAR